MTDFIQMIADLVRLGLLGDQASIRRLASRLTKASDKQSPDEVRLRELLVPLLSESEPSRSLRRSNDGRTHHISRESPPVDDSSFFPLVHVDEADEAPSPFLPNDVERVVQQVVAERKRPQVLQAAGLEPTRTLLLTGAPGVGKTMTARYLAAQIGWPLFTVDLAALVSSLLGKTGQNLRQALNFGQRNRSVLFLDEFDALAKRRDDDSDVGELKRIVNVLLQEIDRWPPTGLLVAATNHPELLDRAVWRRFERTLSLPLPDLALRHAILIRTLATHNQSLADGDVTTLAIATTGMSGSDIGRLTSEAIRDFVVGNDPHLTPILTARALNYLKRGSEAQRISYAGLANAMLGMTQREIAQHLDVSHVTVGKYIRHWATTNSTSGQDLRPKRKAGAQSNGKKQ
ncbi:AAA family ATPase [Myxococcus eversor]|uniref:AAA family ATPase n=1 Tax=Myxococcus eversor TaxID=2709661 RepID=UPI001967B1ED|nr:AAA family ATPase [Myxococcus eversor]